MPATLKTLKTQKTELQAKLAARKASKKSTKEVRAEIEAVEALIAEAEAVTKTASVRRGRPRKYADEFYQTRDSFKRPSRGRPNRKAVEQSLKALNVEVPKDATFRQLEVLLKDEKAKAIAKVKVTA